MSKRFIDSGLFADSWFMQLKQDEKLLWIYLITNCDHAGIIELNVPLVSFLTGIADVEKTLRSFGDRMVNVRANYYFLPGYIKFQYGELRETVNVQRSAIRRLEEFGLWDSESGCITVPDRHQKRQEPKKKGGNTTATKKAPKTAAKTPTVEDVREYCKERKNGIDAELFWHHYNSRGWQVNGRKIKSWKSCVITWEKRNKNSGVRSEHDSAYEQLING